MQLKKTQVQPLTGDPLIIFLGTDAEIEQCEAREEQQAEAIKKIIFNAGVEAVQISRGGERYEIISRSPRKDNAYQISYYDNKGAIMHETYNNDSNGRDKIAYKYISYDEIYFFELLTA